MAKNTTKTQPAQACPSISVIVPCYNYGHFLEKCVASVLAQSGVDVRLLVIDDCSTDESAATGRRLAELEDRVEFRRHDQNKGLISTANEGLAWAQGEFVLLLSADDLLATGALSRATAVMREHPNVGMVYGRAVRAVEGKPIVEPAGRWRSTKLWSGEKWIEKRCRSGHNCIASPEALVRNTIQRTVGEYDSSCRHTSDLNMWLRIAAVSDIAYIRGAAQAIYRVHAQSMWRSQEGLTMDLRERRAAFDSFFAGAASKLDRPERLRHMAARTLARQALWRASRSVDHGLDNRSVQELTDFALEVHPQARGLHEWRGLQLRRRLGPGRSVRFPPFVLTGAARRVRHHTSSLRLRYRGI